MTHPNIATAMARVIVDELARNGVGTFLISPGSRSAALALAANAHPEIETRVILDERSAAFHALGIAKASGTWTALLCTSGTAAANFYPAVIEAEMSCTRLVAITADRPSALVGVGANQTINQTDVYGSHVRGSVTIETPTGPDDLNATWRESVARLLHAGERPPGPVHLNVAFREPTVPVTDDGRTAGVVYPHDTPRLESVAVARPVALEEVDLQLTGSRGLIVAGDGEYDRDRLGKVAEAMGWPVLATAQSGMRGGRTVSTYHHLVTELGQDLTPETVVTVGAIGPSNRLEDLVDMATERVRIDGWGRTIDPRGTATHQIAGDVVDLLARQSVRADPGWSKSWHRANQAKGEEIASVIGAIPTMTGSAVARALNDIDWGSLVVSSSLPIREVDAHLTRGGAVFANRGASGIDGFVSTALGVGAVQERTLAVCGDLSLLHDSNGFIGEVSADVTFIVIDNQGGGLFDDLPQALHSDDFERLFVTPPDRDLEVFAEFHHVGYNCVGDVNTLIAVVGENLDAGGIHIVRVPVDRGEDHNARFQL